ncbi:hypothetical protein [Anthocerotibacter panamensis]|uniref:hypothetical protein n=1 Tax=Anthocerotibacter panamensis TaxID=2857077 RepID=UPI001C403CDE|nr:hypothetical protein [Anthocerotibacter panamensis]
MRIFMGTVKYPTGKAFEGQYGPRVNAVVTLSTGKEVKLWGNPDNFTLTALRRGETVQVLEDDKGKLKLLETDPAPALTPPLRPAQTPATHSLPTAPGWTVDEKQALAERVTQHAELMRFCLEMAQKRFGDLVATEESIRALATTLFIQALK